MTLFGTGASGGGLGAPGTTLGPQRLRLHLSQLQRADHLLLPGVAPVAALGRPVRPRPHQRRLLERRRRTHRHAAGRGGGHLARHGGRHQSPALAQWHAPGRRSGCDGAGASAREPGWSTACLASWRRDMWRRGVGSTYALTTNLGVDAAGEERTSLGYIAQLTANPNGKRMDAGRQLRREPRTANRDLRGHRTRRPRPPEHRGDRHGDVPRDPLASRGGRVYPGRRAGLFGREESLRSGLRRTAPLLLTRRRFFPPHSHALPPASPCRRGYRHPSARAIIRLSAIAHSFPFEGVPVWLFRWCS